MLPPNAHHILTILSLLPLSLALLLSPTAQSPRAQLQPAKRAVRDASVPRSSVLRRTAHVQVGGVDLPLLAHRGESGRKGLYRRATSTSNGTIIHLGTAEDTYVVPVSIGTPATIYPLQLDLASSDLLLASTLCTSTTCPTSLGTTVNPYYDVSKQSSSLQQVNANQTAWNSSYADGTIASGFLIRENLVIGDVSVQGQVIGLINSTNLTLSEQKISGIIGLGFPRLSSLAHVLLEDAADSSSTASSTTTATSSNAAANATSTSAYLPPVLENLVKSPLIPYPVFALALAPPPTNASASTTSSSATASATARYQTNIGSLTLGGVSSLYVSEDSTTGRSIDDIEWHDVMPFGRAISAQNDTSNVLGNTTATATSTSSVANATDTSSDSTRKRRSDVSSLNGLPSTVTELGGEEYLYWTIELKNVSMNGTNVGLTPTYSSIGLPSVALLDAGSNGIYGPQQDVIKLFDQITDARLVAEGQWAVPCDTEMTMGFSFGGRYIQLQPSDWMYAQVESSSMCLAWPMVAPATGNGIDWQLGTPFLKNVYSIFSYGINGIQAPLVGFLPLEDVIVSSTTNTTNTASSNITSTTYDPDSPTPTSIAALSLTKTLATVLPNALLTDPSYTTPTYIYSATPTLLAAGQLQYEGLANSSVYTAVEEVKIVTEISSTSGTGTGTGTGTSSGGGGGNMTSEGATSGALRGRVVAREVVVVLGMMGMLALVL